jgi:hypothetical protein
MPAEKSLLAVLLYRADDINFCTATENVPTFCCTQCTLKNSVCVCVRAHFNVIVAGLSEKCVGLYLRKLYGDVI